jgi:alkylglycerol monooxygenase
VYKSISLDAWRAQSLVDKLRIWIARPGWRPADVSAAWPSTPFDLQRPLYHPPLPRRVQYYCLAQFAILLLVTTHFLGAHQSMSLLHGVGYAIWLGTGLWIVGGLMEMRSHYLFFETLRLLATSVGVIASGIWFGAIALSSVAQAGIVASAFVSIIALWIVFKQPVVAPAHLSTQ